MQVPRPLSDFDQFLDGDVTFVLDVGASGQHGMEHVYNRTVHTVNKMEEPNTQVGKAAKSKTKKMTQIDLKSTVFFLPVKDKNRISWLLVRHPIIQLYCPAKVETRTFSMNSEIYTNFRSVIIKEGAVEHKFPIRLAKKKVEQVFNICCENPVVKFFTIQKIIQERLIPCYNNNEFFVGFLFRSEFLLSLVNIPCYDDRAFFQSWFAASVCDFEKIWRRLISDEMDRTAKPEQLFQGESFAKSCCEALLHQDTQFCQLANSVFRDDSMVKPYISGLSQSKFSHTVNACAGIIFALAVKRYGSDEAGRIALSMFWFRAGILQFAKGAKIDDGLVRLVSFKLIGVAIESITAYHEYLMQYKNSPTYVECQYEVQNFEASVELFTKVSDSADVVIETARNLVPL